MHDLKQYQLLLHQHFVDLLMNPLLNYVKIIINYCYVNFIMLCEINHIKFFIINIYNYK